MVEQEKDHTVLIIELTTILTPEEKEEWVSDLASFTDFNEKVKVSFFDKIDEAVYALEHPKETPDELTPFLKKLDEKPLGEQNV